MTAESTRGPLSILVVDDEPLQRETIRCCIDDEHEVAEAGSVDEALEAAKARSYDLALVDLRLGTDSGLDLVPRLHATAPWLKTVFLTAHATVETAVQAMRLGAIDYLTKPVDSQALRLLVERLAATRKLERQVATLEEDLQRTGPPPATESRSPAMKRVYDVAKTVASSDATVLLRGENGTGKGMVARWIHSHSDRADELFSVVNCPSLSPDLLNSELFGHVKGAFTGAVKSQAGKVEIGEGGTLFLDEIGDLPGSIQAKLLRFIEERRYERVGDPHPREADVRIISATNRDLEAAVEDGSFREDLFYRLNVIELVIPPLRDRPEDIEDLGKNFLRFFANKHNKRIDDFSPKAWDALRSYRWPGNVRELRNAVERAVILCDSAAVPEELLPFSGVLKPNGSRSDGRLVALDQMERQHIEYVLQNTSSIEAAAETLDIAPSTLWRRRRKYDL